MRSADRKRLFASARMMSCHRWRWSIPIVHAAGFAIAGGLLGAGTAGAASEVPAYQDARETMATPDIPLRQFLLRQRAHKERVPDVGALIEDIAQATRRISFLVAPPPPARR